MDMEDSFEKNFFQLPVTAEDFDFLLFRDPTFKDNEVLNSI